MGRPIRRSHPHSAGLPVIFTPTPLAGAWLVAPEPRSDERGFFGRIWCAREFEAHGLDTRIAQVSVCYTARRGTLRGMHYQAAPQTEIKLIRCAAGAIFDVLVDARRDSPAFGRWEGFELSAANRRQLYVSGGLAHGFQCLTDNCEVFYMMSEPYVPALARGLRWNDPAVNIRWPIADPQLSERDRHLPLLADLP